MKRHAFRKKKISTWVEGNRERKRRRTSLRFKRATSELSEKKEKDTAGEKNKKTSLRGGNRRF